MRANAAMIRTLGYAREADLVGVCLLEELNVGAVPTGEIFERLHRAGEVRDVEIELMRRDGGRAVVLFSARALLPADRWPIAFEVVCTDISERTRLEARWRRHERVLTAGTAAGGTAVDIQQLMTAILGYYDLLAEAVKEPHARADLAQLREAADTVMMLARQLLAFLRPRVLHPVRTDVNALLQELLPRIQDTLGDTELRVTCVGGRGEVVVDADEFSHAVLTLASAASDAAPGSAVTILVDTPYLDATFSREHTAVPPGNYTAVTMSTMAGSDESLAAPDWERERFFTVDMLDGGNALALARAYAFAKQNAGHLTVRRSERDGVTFKIYLPRVAPPGRRRTILLVEDEPRVRSSSRRVLEHLGYAAIEAADAQEALWLAVRHPGPIHLLLSDVVLPGMSAQDLADRLLLTRPATRILFMSGLPKETLVQRGALRDDAPFIDKPFGVDDIAARLDEMFTSDPA